MVITYVMISSLAVYALVVEVLSRARSSPDLVSSPDIIRYVFYGVAVSIVFLVQFFRAMFLRDFRGLDVDQSLARLQTATLVSGALSEVPAMLGLVQFIVFQQYADFYVLAAVSLYLFARHFPRYGAWKPLESRE